MYWTSLLLVFSQLHAVARAYRIQVPDLSVLNYTKLGDFNLGVVLSVHDPELATVRCRERVRDLGLLQRLEAIVYAIEEINNSDALLPNHTLGYTIFDDCYRDITALAQSLHFSTITAADTCMTDDMDESGLCLPRNSLKVVDVVGVIGSESSSATYSMSQLLTSYRKPQLSYLSTTPVLSEKSRFPYFGRTVSSDQIQAKVIAQLLRHYNWTYVSLVYSEGMYGSGAYKAIKYEASQVDICFSQEYEILESFTERQYQDVVQSLLLEPRSRIVVAFIPSFTGKKLLEKADRLIHEGKITWIAADAWLRDPDLHTMGHLAGDAKGALSINIQGNSVPRFDAYFQGLSLASALRNPWMEDYLSQYLNCTSTSCDSRTSIASHPEYAPETTVSLVFDAVYAFAHALDALAKECPEDIDSNRTFIDCVKHNVTRALKNVQFPSESGDSFQFNDNMDRRSTYDIYNVQTLENESFGLVRIAEWKPDIARLNFFDNSIEWPRGVQPTSQCSVECQLGEAKLMEAKKCCWTCIKCEPNQVVCTTRFGNEKCEACQNMTWPDATQRRRCVAIIPTYVKWDDPMAIALAALAASGIAVCILVAIVYIINNNHALIKACSRELSYFMLFGLLCSFVFVFSFLTEPNYASCSTSMFGVGISFTIIYAPLTTKTIRIWRIFQSGRKMNRHPRFVNSKSQLVICTVTVLFVGLIVGLSTYLADMNEEDMIQVKGDGTAEKMCRFPIAPFVTCIGVNVLFLIICSVFAFITRSLPDNFNESKFIAFCVYSTVVLWIAFISAYFLTQSVYRVLFLSVMEIANATVCICSIYVPKIYAIYFLDKTALNIRLAEATSGYHQGRPNQFLDEENGRELGESGEGPASGITTGDKSNESKQKDTNPGPSSSKNSKTSGKVAPADRVAESNKVIPTGKVASTGKVATTGKVSFAEKMAPTGKVAPVAKVAPIDKMAPAAKVASTGKVAPAEKVAPNAKVAPVEKVAPTGKSVTPKIKIVPATEQKVVIKAEEKKTEGKPTKSTATHQTASIKQSPSTSHLKEDSKVTDRNMKPSTYKPRPVNAQQGTKTASKTSEVKETAPKDSDKAGQNLTVPHQTTATVPHKTTETSGKINSPGDGAKGAAKVTPVAVQKQTTASAKPRPPSSVTPKTMSDLTRLFSAKSRPRAGSKSSVISTPRTNFQTSKTTKK